MAKNRVKEKLKTNGKLKKNGKTLKNMNVKDEKHEKRNKTLKTHFIRIHLLRKHKEK